MASAKLQEAPRQGAPQRAPLKQGEKIWVAATLVLILFLVGTSQACIIVPYFLSSLPSQNGKTLRLLVKLLLPFNVGATGILWNYALCVSMDPGGVPRGWSPPSAVQLGDDQKAATPTSIARVVVPRYCKPCKAYKPPRAHHCRTCKRCVLRMDHHCPWIANCVGQRNYASFMRFLACVDVTCAMHLGLLVARTSDYWWLQMGGIWRTPSTFEMTFLVLNFALCLPTFLLVGVFSLYHFWNLCTNTTTIEGWEKDKVERMINRGRIHDREYPFDLGTLRNVRSVLGRSPLLWCVPSATVGHGLDYEVSGGIDPLEQYDWPPRDPSKAERSRQKADLSGDPFTFGSESFNPALRASNGTALRNRKASRVSPWHPDYNQVADEGDEDDLDTAAEAGVDTGESCLPPAAALRRDGQAGNPPAYAHADEVDTSSASGSEDEPRAVGADYTKSRVRRGSEGYEVRPKRFDVAVAEELDAQYREDIFQDDWDADHLVRDDALSDADSAVADASDDDAAWVWRQRQREEERVRRQIQAEWRRQLRESRQNGQFVEHDMATDYDAVEVHQGAPLPPVLLPSQVQQRRTASSQPVVADEVGDERVADDD